MDLLAMMANDTNKQQHKTMAKKNTAPTQEAPPIGADKSGTTPDEPAKKKIGRPKGFSTKDNDVFIAVDPQPETKIAPQAKGIANLVVAAGPKGLTRKQLVENMEGVIETRQPQGRILSYYQKLLIDQGYVTVVEGKSEAPAETKV